MMADKTSDELSPPPLTRPGPPPLRIHHILAATAVTSALLAVTKLPLGEGDQGATSFMQSGSNILATVGTGLAITCIGFGINWRSSGRRFFDQPDHWLLILEALPKLFFDLMIVVSFLLHRFGLGRFEHLPLVIYGIFIFLGLPILGALAAWKGADCRWWRWCLILQGLLVFTIPILGMVGWSVTRAIPAISCGLLVLLLAPVVADRMADRSRNWPHWLGVASWFSAIVMTLIASMF